MEAAAEIRKAVERVSLLRQTVNGIRRFGSCCPNQAAAIAALRRHVFDLLSAEPYAAATRFFLDGLYSDKDYAERDAQFARIAGAIQRLFPTQVAATAVALAQLHAFTEELDQATARAWLAQKADPSLNDVRSYVAAWRQVGRRADRERQLAAVIDLGHRLARLTRTPGLRTMLKMMRAPALASGLGSLQHFLETGFRTFGDVVRRRGADEFLSIVHAREAAVIALLFDADRLAAESGLAATLGET